MRDTDVVATNIQDPLLCEEYNPVCFQVLIIAKKNVSIQFQTTWRRCINYDAGDDDWDMVTCRPEPSCDSYETEYGMYTSREDCLDYYGASMLCVSEDSDAYDCRDFTGGCNDDEYQYPGVGVYFKRDNCSGPDGTELKVIVFTYSISSFPYLSHVFLLFQFRLCASGDFSTDYYAWCSSIPDSCDSYLWEESNNEAPPTWSVSQFILSIFYS